MTYKYSDHIETPDKFFSHKAKKIDKNIDNMFVFIDLLTKAKNKATRENTLGDRYFVETIGKCALNDGTGRKTKRYLWVDNEVREGEGGLLTSMVNTLNDMTLDISATTPMCQCVKGMTRGNDHVDKPEYHHISMNDFNNNKEDGILEASSQCSVSDDEDDTETFGNIHYTHYSTDPMYKMYFTTITLLGAYILFLLYSKKH